jgi:predicted lipoprotein with Yx(FWY)xxD motif
MKTQFLVAIACLGLARPALADSPTTPADISINVENGAYIARTTQDTMSIYTYDRDTPGKSACIGACAQRWPPVTVTPHSRAIGDWTMILRADGNSQWAYKGHPLYKFAGDKPGQKTGDGVGGVWHLLPPIPEDRRK